jgi:APA family basic amino acid/polyamine antiporter
VGATAAPLAAAVAAGTWDAAGPLVRVGGAAASLGALLALIAGVGRTTLAMARESDLPSGLAAVHPRYKTPHHAEVASGAAVVVLVLSVDLRGAIGFSSFGVLLYYPVANAAAFTQKRPQRRFPRSLQVLGALGCAVLVVTLPAASIAVGAGVLAVGALYRAVATGAAPSRG